MEPVGRLRRFKEPPIDSEEQAPGIDGGEAVGTSRGTQGRPGCEKTSSLGGDWQDVESEDPMTLKPHLRRIHKLGHVKQAYASNVEPEDLDQRNQGPCNRPSSNDGDDGTPPGMLRKRRVGPETGWGTHVDSISKQAAGAIRPEEIGYMLEGPDVIDDGSSIFSGLFERVREEPFMPPGIKMVDLARRRVAMINEELEKGGSVLGGLNPGKNPVAKIRGWFTRKGTNPNKAYSVGAAILPVAAGAMIINNARDDKAWNRRKFKDETRLRRIDNALIAKSYMADGPATKLGMLKHAYTLQGHEDFQGLNIAIENRKGSVRKGTDADGKEWTTKMVHPYGYIVGSKGADGDGVDTYVGPTKDAPNAFVVHQRDKDTGEYDEDKVMLGFNSKREAKEAYLKHYNSPKFLGPMMTVDMDRLKELVASKKRLVKIAERQPRTNSALRFVRKAGPAIGALVGGAASLSSKGRSLSKTIQGVGTGATLGWLPDIAASGLEATKSLRLKPAVGDALLDRISKSPKLTMLQHNLPEGIRWGKLKSYASD